jgi:hypothetical protein
MPTAAQRKDNHPPTYASNQAQDEISDDLRGVNRYPGVNRQTMGNGGMVVIFLVAAAALVFGAYYYYANDTAMTSNTAPNSSQSGASTKVPVEPPVNPPTESASQPPVEPAPVVPADPPPSPAIDPTPAAPPSGTQQ